MDYENHAKKQKNIEPVPYIAYESAVARLERIRDYMQESSKN